MRMRLGQRVYFSAVGGRYLKRWLFLMLTVAVMFALLFVFNTRLRPLFASVAESYARSATMRVIDSVVNEVMSEENISYKSLVDIMYDNDKNVVAISANVIEVNRLKARVSAKIGEQVSELGTMTARIPLGNFIGNEFFSGIGPRIPIRLVPLAYSRIDMSDDFRSAGINQTLHTLYLNVHASVSVLLPVIRGGADVETVIPIAQTMIVGKVPESYTTIEGVTSDAPDSALNLLN